MAERVRASEAGLAPGASHEAFAAAMLKCQSPSGHCCYAGFCAFDGECFRTDDAARRRALRVLDDLANQQPADVAAWLHTARRALLAEARNEL